MNKKEKPVWLECTEDDLRHNVVIAALKDPGAAQIPEIDTFMTTRFDNTMTISDDAGNPVRFLFHPLDEKYIESPGYCVPEGMLPPEDLEVRRALRDAKFYTDRLATFGILARLFNTKKYRRACATAYQKASDLMVLVNSTREHKAAIRRIVDAMPMDNGGREVLAPFTK